jgi:hypothetical protein
LREILGRLHETPLIYRLVFPIAVLLLLGLIFAAIDLTPDLSRMRVTVLSGPKGGQDDALVEELARATKRHPGMVVNTVTASTAASLERLAEAGDGGDTLFAVAPDALSYPNPDKLELVARP